MDDNLIVKDKKGRPIIKVDGNGNILVGRYVDMEEICKEFVCEVYCDLTGGDPVKIMSFLNYESNEGEFCS